MKEVDILFKNGRIIDGSGHKSIYHNIGIKNGKIEYIGLDNHVKATMVIDIKGKVICPGFIDVHSHSDMSLPFDNRLESMVRQGVTTSLIGNCGSSLAPINDDTKEMIQKEFDTFSPRGHKVKIEWNTFKEYMEHLEKQKSAMNIATLVGYGTVRIASGPAYENREPTEEEYKNMRKDVAEAMEAGAFGLSTGLFYAPQVFASTNEIIEVAKVLRKYNGLYASHIRSEGETVVDAVKEVIEIVKQTKCRRGQISHHKIAGKAYWGNSKATLKLIEDANRADILISCDQYPYNRGMTSLTALLPPWVHEGGMDALLESIAEPDSKEEIQRDVNDGIEGWENIIKEDGWHNVYIASAKTDEWSSIQGRSLQEIAEESEYEDKFDLLYEILEDEEGEVTITIRSMGEEDIQRIMKSKYTAIATDGWGIAPSDIFKKENPHPRSYGTYPKILGEYVREKKILKIEDAIWKMTGFPAEILGIKDRGRLREGFWADIVVFDPRKINDTATYLDPHKFPVGIDYVLVNGEFVVFNDTQLKALPGKILRRNRK